MKWRSLEESSPETDIRPLREIWPNGRVPLSIHWVIKAVQMLGKAPVSGGLRIAWSDDGQRRLALGEQEG